MIAIDCSPDDLYTVIKEGAQEVDCGLWCAMGEQIDSEVLQNARTDESSRERGHSCLISATLLSMGPIWLKAANSVLKHKPSILFIEFTSLTNTRALADIIKHNFHSRALPSKPLFDHLLQLLETLVLVLSVHVLVADLRQDGCYERVIL